MTVDIDDSVSPEERRRLLILIPTLYALKKYKTKTAAAKFLGISQRSVRNRVNELNELKEWRRTLMDTNLPDHVSRYFNKELWGGKRK